MKRMMPLITAVSLLVMMCGSVFASAAPVLKPVQVFDTKAGEVVKTVENNDTYQAFAKSWLKTVTGIAPTVQTDDKCGYVYRIPLQESTEVTLNNTTLLVKDVFLFNCAGKEPLLLVFHEDRKPYLLRFQTDIKPFILKIGVPGV